MKLSARVTLCTLVRLANPPVPHQTSDDSQVGGAPTFFTHKHCTVQVSYQFDVTVALTRTRSTAAASYFIKLDQPIYCESWIRENYAKLKILAIIAKQ